MTTSLATILRYMGDWAGAAELEKMLGVSRQRVQQIVAQPAFPAPAIELAMGKIWRTGRTPHETVEVAPTHCANGHRLGPLQVLVGFDEHPSGVGRARVWTCRACGHQTWADPSPI